MSISPDVWGPMLWRILHSYSLNYPVRPTESDKARAVAYYQAIPTYISCSTCAAHFAQLVSENSPVTDSRASLAEWMFDIHNLVNARIGKPQFTQEQFLRAYSPSIKDDQPVPDIGTRLTGALISGLFHSLN